MPISSLFHTQIQHLPLSSPNNKQHQQTYDLTLLTADTPLLATEAAVGALTSLLASLPLSLSSLRPARSAPLTFLRTTSAAAALPPETFLTTTPDPPLVVLVAPAPVAAGAEAAEAATLLARPRRSLIWARACSRVMVGVSAGSEVSKLGLCWPSADSSVASSLLVPLRDGVRCIAIRRLARVGPSAGSSRRGTLVVVVTVVVVDCAREDEAVDVDVEVVLVL